MKTIDFKKLGVSEMSHSDMLTTEGGSWLSRAWKNVSDTLCAVAQCCYDAALWIGSHFE